LFVKEDLKRSFIDPAADLNHIRVRRGPDVAFRKRFLGRGTTGPASGAVFDSPDKENIVIQITLCKDTRNRLRHVVCAVGLLLSLAALPAHGQYVHQLSYNGSNWMDQNLNGVPANVYTEIEAFVTTPNDQTHVYYVSSLDTSHVHQLFYNGVSWSDEDLTTLSGAAPATPGSSISGFSVGNFQYVYYIGEEEDVHQLLYNNSRWIDTNLSSLTGGPIAVELIAFTTSPALHVYYVDYNDFHIHQLFSPDGSSWQDQDMSGLTGGTTASTSWMSGFNIGNFQYVYFVDSNSHVHQFLYNNSSWTDRDLTALTKTLPVIGHMGVQALVIPGTKKLRVYLEASNGHLLQLASPNGTTWSSTDLTKKAKAPPADAGDQIAAFATTPDKALHVFYVSYVGSGPTPEHILQLTQPTASTWAYEDLTALTNGGNPLDQYGSLTGFSLNKDQYLFYVAQ
jgi:hypothetical protein